LESSSLLRAFAWARLGAAAALGVAAPLASDVGPATHAASLGAALVVAGGSSIAVLAWRPAAYPRRVAALLCTLDTVLITAVVAATGGSRSLFAFVYVLSVTAACVVLSRPGALAIAATATALYSGLVFGRTVLPIAFLFETPDETTALEVVTIFLNGGTFLIVAIVAGGLAERYRATQRELETRRRDLRDLEAFRDLVFDCVGTGLIVLDREHRVTAVNRAAMDIAGRDAATLKGLAWNDAIASDITLTAMSHALDAAPVRRESVITRPDGSHVPVLVTFSALRSAAGTRVGTVAACEDLSTVRRMEERMRQADRLASLGRMSANIAHEIRNPLASLTGAIEALGARTSLGDQERDRLTDIVLRESDRLNAIIGDFLAYARPAPLQRARIDVSALVEEVLLLLEHGPLPSGVKLVRAFPDGLHAEVDGAQVRQALWNLALNAAEAMPAGGEMSVTAGIEARTLTIAVSDTGPGIPGSALPHVFEPFFSTKSGGSGLGLAIVDRVTRDHGGDVLVSSTPEVGTTVMLRIPASSHG
jgi:two-component system sensor histidine kinase PilS (NtrC family)